MVDKKVQDSGKDEAIVPVNPGLHGSLKSVASAENSKQGVTVPLSSLWLGALIVIAVIVFFFLPGWVEEEPLQPVEAILDDVSDVAEPETPVFTPDELEAFRLEAEALLAQLITQQGQLDDQSVADWGGEDFEQYEALAKAGDDAYLSNAFYDAVPAYIQAIDAGEILLTRSINLIEAALSAAANALDAGNADLALEQFQLVLSIEPENAIAKVGLARAQNLPEVLSLVKAGEDNENAADYEAAAERYRQALVIDELWHPARTALEGVKAIIIDREFDALMSLGLRALAEEEYSDANNFFLEALAIRPDSPEAENSLIQAQQGQRLDEIALAEARAIAFESRELWDMAVQLYTEALETDDTLEFAQQGLLRARVRYDLDAKLVNLIENPNLLFNDQTLTDAQSLLTEAYSIQQPGPLLESQTSDLSRLVQIASTPIPVEIYSDELTEVTVYRVGRMGKFLFKQLELKPGTYTVIGSRVGYVDVRQELIVLPGSDLEPITVQCMEPI